VEVFRLHLAEEVESSPFLQRCAEADAVLADTRGDDVRGPRTRPRR
jgi:hypothetical protein